MDKAHFIYVFSDKDKNMLLSLGYDLIKSDEAQHIYIFGNREELTFSTSDINFVLTDTLTF